MGFLGSGLFGEHVADSLMLGDSFAFGRYQGDDIEWRVLTRGYDRGKHFRVLLLSDRILDFKRFHEEDKEVTWGECTLRTWLNGEFMYAAFSDDERKKIREVENNEGVPGWVVKGMNVTHDKVFCLSSYDAKHYFPNRYDLKCPLTKFAKSQEGSEYPWWWLRSSNHQGSSAASDRAAYIQQDCYSTIGVTTILGVRPAMWIA